MKKSLLTLIGILSFCVLVWKVVSRDTQIFLSTPDILGGSVRVAGDGKDRLYYLTTQWEKRLTRIGGIRGTSSPRSISWLYVDLWAFDAETARPVFRKRLKRDKVNGDAKAMGMDQGVLWARIPELVGVRLTDGTIVADSAKIEARNPSLAGLMPKPPQTAVFLTDQIQPLKFDPDAGLVILLADARRVRIDPLTLEATPYVPSEKKKPSGEKTRSAVIQLNNGMDWRALVRGISMERADGGLDWLGLIAGSELADAKERHIISNQMNFSDPQQHRFYRARLKPIKDFFGPRFQFTDPVVLPESPEFLMAGLLTQESGKWDEQTALWRRNPDSVFVLSRDRLGDDGRLQLARVGGPAGKPVWSTGLPLAGMSSWIPGGRHAIMLGPDPSAARSPMAEERENDVMQVVSIDLDTGALHSFNPDLHRDWPVDDDTKKNP